VAPRLAECEATGKLYRIARAPDPWAWQPWESAHDDLTFGNRWDDPKRVYRVLYASTSPIGCYLEVLAWYRRDLRSIADMDDIVENDDDALPKTQHPGTIRLSWLNERMIGTIVPSRGVYADVGDSESIACLNSELAAEIVGHGLDELDGAAIRQKAPRTLTREISRFVFEASTSAGEPFAGLYYESRHGNDLHNFALFEPSGKDRWDFVTEPSRQLREDDPDFKRALDMLGITLTVGA
jgi:RES domain